jgi:hypothetical protein
MAESKAPAATWSAASTPCCSQRCDAGTPAVGAANTAASPAAAGAGAMSGGSSRSWAPASWTAFRFASALSHAHRTWVRSVAAPCDSRQSSPLKPMTLCKHGTARQALRGGQQHPVALRWMM